MDWGKDSGEILDALDKPILAIDCNYQIVSANRAARESFTSPGDSIVGHECYKITHKADSPCWQADNRCPVKLAIESRGKSSCIHQHYHADNAVALEEIIAYPILDEQGEVRYVVEELHDVTELVQSKEVVEHLKNELNALRGIIPICASCKKVRNDEGYWQQVEIYVRERTDAEFSHGICPDCMEKLYPEYPQKPKNR